MLVCVAQDLDGPAGQVHAEQALHTVRYEQGSVRGKGATERAAAEEADGLRPAALKHTGDVAVPLEGVHGTVRPHNCGFRTVQQALGDEVGVAA